MRCRAPSTWIIFTVIAVGPSSCRSAETSRPAPASDARTVVDPAVTAAMEARRAAIRAILKEYEDARAKWNEGYREAAAKGTANEWSRANPMPTGSKYTSRVWPLVDGGPGDEAGFLGLDWITANSHWKERNKALELIERDHLQRPELALLCGRFGNEPSAEVEKFLVLCLSESRDHDVRGSACLALAKLKHTIADDIGRLRGARLDMPPREGTMVFGLARKKEELMELDLDRVTEECAGLLERVRDEFGDVVVDQKGIADEIPALLYEVRNLTVGKPAPEIAGEDVNGVAFKLSDYRGKVVMLDFWGFW